MNAIHPTAHPLPVSMLDLVAVREGATVADALALALRTARHVEALGFTRYWMAEHHNMPGIASSATAVLVGHVAGGTQRIRVGSGGVMLPNHAPLVVAEAFGTLAELYPDRIDLGLGRAPGTDPLTLRALRRSRVELEEDFPRDVSEVRHLLSPPQAGQRLVAMPGAGTQVPLWLLGSSLYSARLAGEMGLPYAFASHFAPQMLHEALAVYRQHFRASAQQPRPHAMVAAPVVVAPSDAEAELLASSVQQRVLGIVTGRRGLLPPPVPGFMDALPAHERAAVNDFLACAAIGSPATVQTQLQRLLRSTEADELMLVCDVFDPELRLRSLTLAASAVEKLQKP
jgi:luciferase family oxidoreductase group 1